MNNEILEILMKNFLKALRKEKELKKEGLNLKNPNFKC